MVRGRSTPSRLEGDVLLYQCHRCLGWVGKDAFSRRSCLCGECRRTRDREYERKNRERVEEKRRRRYRTVEGRSRALWHRASDRASHQGVDCSITVAWVAERIVAGRCEITGIPFDLDRLPGTCKGSRSPWAPSIDRLDPTGAYVPENCRVVVWIYNLAKNRWQHSDLLRLAKGLLGREK